MSADQLLQLITQSLFVVIFVAVGIRTLRRPHGVNVNTALLFGVLSLVVAEGWVLEALDIASGRWLTAISSILVMSLPYLLMRLVDDFTEVPHPVMWLAEIGLALAAAALLVTRSPYPTGTTLICVLYFVGFTVYVAVAFVRAARRSNGVTRRRMQAVAAGSFCLASTIFLAGIHAAVPAWGVWWGILGDLSALCAGLGYFVGFAPPLWLRRTWQEPEVRAFLRETTRLVRLPSQRDVIAALERGTAAAFGAPNAVVGMWDQSSRTLRYATGDAVFEEPDDAMVGGRAFTERRPVLSLDTARDDPAHAERYRRSGAHTILAAPITAGERRLGVLAIYALRAPIFAEDDLDLVALFAGQIAVVLESHILLDEEARVRAREETTRLKDDFLSAAAHDLKTPLTAVVGQAQLLERRARRDPLAPADLRSIERIVSEAQRLKALVLELLDATRVEQGRLLGRYEPVDLTAVLREICARHTSQWHRCILQAPDSVIGSYDRARLTQLFENLVENAVKYSPKGGEIIVTMREDGPAVHVAVADPGIGIPAGDLPHLFDRFHRGSNVDDRTFAGLGLGLFICRGIVEQHGGSIRATSRGPGHGSTFEVMLPLTSSPDAAPDLRGLSSGAIEAPMGRAQHR